MSRLRLVAYLTTVLSAVASPLACASAPVAPASPQAPASSALVAATASTAPSAAASAAAEPAPAASASEVAAPPPAPTAEAPPPPCVDGDLVMGTCLCPKGKGADATGHCVYMPCPRSASGGEVFRDDATGQCMECRPGTKPTKDGKCER